MTAAATMVRNMPRGLNHKWPCFARDRVPGGVRRCRLTRSRTLHAAMDHAGYMRLALEHAARAREAGEVPIGAVVVSDGKVLGVGRNQPIAAIDPTAHAEITAIRAAAAAVHNYRLTGATLYVTVEPCLMCVGAMIHARIGLVVYGAAEPRGGALVSAARAHETPGLNHRLAVLGGVLEDECRTLIQDFFKERR
jgi:tRNA(adenine34) deaminase